MGVRKWWFEAPSTTPAGDAVAYGFGGRGIAFIEYPLAANSIGILYLADAIESPVRIAPFWRLASEAEWNAQGR